MERCRELSPVAHAEYELIEFGHAEGWMSAAYLKGVHVELCQGVFEWHKADPAPHAWVSLATKSGDPVVVHTYAGFGRLVALTVPMFAIVSPLRIEGTAQM